MLTSSVFLQTSIPNIPSITVLSLHLISSTRAASSNLVHRIYAHARPRIPSSLNSGAWKNGAQSTAQAHSPKGRKRLTVLLAAHQICLFAKQSATYKGRELPRAPRTEPYVRLSRIRLPPRVCDGKAFARPRMEDDWFREPVVHQLRHPFPRHPILLAASPQRAPPKVGDLVPEHVQCTGIGWHCVVVEVAVDDVPQPFPLLGDRLVHAPPHLLFDHRELRSHAVPPGLPFDLEFSRAGLPADEGEAHEVEGLRFAEPSPLAAFRRKASKLDEPGLLGVQ